TKYLLTVPKEPTYDTDLTVTITALTKPEVPENITLEFRGLKDKSKVLNSTQINFSEDETKNWTVVFPWERMLGLDETGVLLKMRTTNEMENVVEKDLSLKFRNTSGYIFIQTDKPIYTPRQTVKFRIIALDEYQRLTKYPIKVDIKNPQGVILERMRYSAEDAFKSQEFELPKDTPPGIWTISANLEGLGQLYSLAHTVAFEVREYVLPRFSAVFKIDTDVITMDTTWIRMNVTAKYVYGQPVVGKVEMRLGTWDENSSVTLIPSASYRGELINGVFKRDVKRSSLFPTNESFNGVKRLYVQVNVTETATQETITIEDTSTFVSHPYYEVDFTPSKTYFKPGFPYTVHVQVKARSGRLASWVLLYLHPKFYDSEKHLLRESNNHVIVQPLDMYGKLSMEVQIPLNADRVIFSAIVMDFAKIKFNEYILNVSKLASDINEYIVISMPTPIQKIQRGEVILNYTKPRNLLDKITVLVIAKGYVIYTLKNITKNNNGSSTIYLPTSLRGDASPSMRIVAYYWTMGEIIMDSLFIEAPVKYCVEELYVNKGGLFSTTPLKPKDKLNIDLRGGSNMRVGLVAVDKAVLLLNDKQTLTRKLLFNELEKHDQGTHKNNGTFEEILKSNGLQYIFLDTVQVESDDPPPIGTVKEDGFDETDSFIAMQQALPPQTVRSYFPESWMFEEHVLPKSGFLRLSWPLPDSITTWSVLVVGVSANRGVCVSEPVDQIAMKMFFADVHVPYKATRLEEVKVKIAIYNFYNYTLAVQGTVTSEPGLCISSNSSQTFNSGTSLKTLTFSMNIAAFQTASEIIKVIPLKVGELGLLVHVKSQKDEDIVKKTLHVVSEGLRVFKTITFVLDPEAKHATFQGRTHFSTIRNHIDKIKKQQFTTIDLALPKDVIKGTEFCGISAFGDLMGDIITHGIVRSKSFVDQPLVNAEEVIGDLGPAVFALQYVNDTKLLTDELKNKGQRFLLQGITRLLNYRKENAFSLHTDSSPATWLTASVVKILCHIEKANLTFIDKENLIDNAINWIMRQRREDGSLKEADPRLSQESLQYKIMLAADVMISLLECNKDEEQEAAELIMGLVTFIENNIDNINNSLALAKAAYAMKLFEIDSESTAQIITKLKEFMKRDKLSRLYWSDSVIDNPPRQPIWYHQGATAAAIEATSYALLVFLDHSMIKEEAIADWLVAQRNPSGAFIGAMDSTVAIQALTKYSQKRYVLSGNAVFLRGNITSDITRSRNHLHSFKFTEENATSPASVKNVPVGQVLEVFTEGQGLGQMHVNVEYNIPIEKNLQCHYNVTVEIKPIQYMPSSVNTSPLCQYCNIGCPANLRSRKEISDVSPIIRIGRARSNLSKSRAVRSSSHSKKVYCFHVCLRFIRTEGNVPINIKMDMLSGFKPVASDLELIKSGPNVLHVEFQAGTETLVIQLSKVDTESPSCFGFRVVDDEEVERKVPAALIIQQVGHPVPSCTLEYHLPDSLESLKVFCADFSHINRGECRCYSGLCSKCRPTHANELDLDKTKKLVCKKEIAYQLRLGDVQDKIHWMEIDARVLSLNKTGSHKLEAGDTIKMMSPSSCSCLVNNYRDEDFYMLSKDVERLVDRRGETV
ncbi:BgC3-1.p1, partial [Biomphalaria glabrata]